jgi:hypothetical protein
MMKYFFPGKGSENYLIRKSISLALICLSLCILVLQINGISFASELSIWDNDASIWTTILSNGAPVDPGTTDANRSPIAIDSNGIVYTAIERDDGTNTHIYVSRYNGTDVRIWDTNSSSWTTTLANGDPIDTGMGKDAHLPQIAIDSNNIVYVVFQQNGHIYLSRYNGTDVRIWDTDTSSWTTTFANGDPIDTGGSENVYSPRIAIDPNNVLYITYGASLSGVYLSRYNGTDVRIWDTDTSSWTVNLVNGDPIDSGGISHLAIDSNSVVYITYVKDNNFYLSRYISGFQVWDNDTSSWTSNFTNGDPLGTGETLFGENQIAIDSNNIVYVTFIQSEDGINSNVYLSRYDGTRVRIWDNDTSSWTTTFANGDPIDTGTGTFSRAPAIAIDLNGIVYVTYSQFPMPGCHIYLSRYNGTDVRIWDNDTSSWTTTFANGDSISIGGTHQDEAPPYIVIDSNDVVYVVYDQNDGTNYRPYLSRYDGTNVSIWDNDISGWTTSISNGDPIDTGVASNSFISSLAIDANRTVYYTFRKNDGVNYRIYLGRYLYADVANELLAFAGSFGLAECADACIGNYDYDNDIDGVDLAFLANRF